MGAIHGRRLARLTLDNLDDLPIGCRSCTFWELDPVRRRRAEVAGDGAAEKEAWVSRALLEWGSCGQVAYVDNDPAGYVLFAPPTYLPGADAFPTAPVSEDAVLLATAMVFPEYDGQRPGPGADAGGREGPGQAGRDPGGRGDRGHPGRRRGERGSDTYGGCVLPADYLLGVGFKTHRPHARYPRMRLELRSVVTWRDEVESALERLLGAVRPARHPVADPTRRALRRGGHPGDA